MPRNYSRTINRIQDKSKSLGRGQERALRNLQRMTGGDSDNPHTQRQLDAYKIRQEAFRKAADKRRKKPPKEDRTEDERMKERFGREKGAKRAGF